MFVGGRERQGDHMELQTERGMVINGVLEELENSWVSRAI